MLVEAGNRGNILDYTVWTAGTSGSEQGFPANGAALENYRVMDTGPQGNEITVWEARPDSASNADGGWVNTFPIDNTKMYRFSVWIRRTVQGNGSAYLGLIGYGSTNGVLNRSNGLNNTNPYFYVSGTPSPTTGEWSLWVGHVWPKGSGTGAQHPDSGRYTVENGRIGNISQDFVWREETTTARHRSYLYYSTNTETRQQFCYPRVDLCDGSEPTIEDLLYGLDERWEVAGFPTTTSIRENTVTPNLSELGVTRGLVAYYPLIGDTKDYAGTNHATNNGAVATAEGYEFDGTASLSANTAIPTTGTQEWTVSALVRLDQNSVGTQYLLNFNMGIRLTHTSANNNTLLYLNSGENDSYAYGGTLPLGEWVHLTAVVDETTQDARLYLNGQVYGTAGNWQPTDVPSGIPSTTTIGGGTYGAFRDLRIHNVALTPEEVAIQAKLSLNQKSKVLVTENCLYTAGQIKEVIA